MKNITKQKALPTAITEPSKAPTGALQTVSAAHAVRLAEKVDTQKGDAALSPAFNASLVITAFQPGNSEDRVTDILSVADKIARMAESIRTGDLAEVEGLLLAQAAALNVIFTNYCMRSVEAAKEGTPEGLARRGEGVSREQALREEANQARADQLLLLALRAQACSRATLGTLVDLKFPRTTVFARQANLAGGHQQVNNGGTSAAGHDDEQGGAIPAKPCVEDSSVGQFPRARARAKARPTRGQRGQS
jgi:hypothetical protein